VCWAQKVKWLAESIAEIGLLEPIDVLEVDGAYWGFSGCHRYEAHQVLGLETIRCRVIKSTARTLKYAGPSSRSHWLFGLETAGLSGSIHAHAGCT